MHPTLTQQLLDTLCSHDFATLRPTVSKADQRGEVWVPFLMYLPFRSQAPINAAKALLRLETSHPVPLQSRSTTALFRDNQGKPLTVRDLRVAFKCLIKAVLPKSEHNKYSMHSFRIFLATALKDAGADNLLVQFLVRWQTEESLKLYCRMQPKRQGKWLDKSLTAHINPAIAESEEFPTVDNHNNIAAVMKWASDDPAPTTTSATQPSVEQEAEEIMEQQEHELTEFIATTTAPIPFGTMVWQSCSSPQPEQPHGVLYKVVGNNSDAGTPCQQYMYVPHLSKHTRWHFSKSRKRKPWQVPQHELTDVSNDVMCARCGCPVTTQSPCKHTHVIMQAESAPVHTPTQPPPQPQTLGTHTEAKGLHSIDYLKTLRYSTLTLRRLSDRTQQVSNEGERMRDSVAPLF
jgi:hypothetical protein